MRRPDGRRLALTGALIAALGAALSPAPATAAMTLGVNTHFEQGWPLKALDKVRESGAQSVRESLNWAKIERAPGQYDFNAKNSGFLETICARRIPVLLMIMVRNKIYDGGGPPASAATYAAYGRFTRAVVERFPCVTAVEVGNEVNAVSAKYPDSPRKAENYVALVRATRDALAGSSRPVTLVGGSSLMVATGFLERLFKAGLLPLVDAVAVHPYADMPETLPAQLARLRAAMMRAGGEKPVWATEFGLYYATPEEAPRHAWRVMAILSAAGVARADWYALLDEPWYPNMGLYGGGRPKPALQMFQRVARALASEGDARRIDAGDPLTFVYRFGDGTSVLWASGRQVTFAPGASLIDAQGGTISPPAALGPDPVIAAPGTRWTLGPVRVLADSYFDAGTAPWQATVTGPGGWRRPLGWVDTNWASHIGVPGMPRLILSGGLVAVPSSSQRPLTMVERFRSPVTGTVWLSSCFTATKAAAPAITITHQDRPVVRLVPGTGGPQETVRLNVDAGDGIALRYDGPPAAGVASVRRRIRILTEPEAGPALCPPRPSGTQ